MLKGKTVCHPIICFKDAGKKVRKKRIKAVFWTFEGTLFQSPQIPSRRHNTYLWLKRILCSFVSLLSSLFPISACLLFVVSMLPSFQLTRRWTALQEGFREGLRDGKAGKQRGCPSLAAEQPVTWSSHIPAWVLASSSVKWGVRVDSPWHTSLWILVLPRPFWEPAEWDACWFCSAGHFQHKVFKGGLTFHVFSLEEKKPNK